MKSRVYATFFILLIILISVLVMIIPTFFTNGISRIELKQEIDLPLILNDEKDIKLIFFGYAGCADICTPRLDYLSKMYEKLDEETKQRVGVEFIDISAPIDTTLPQKFAEAFHKDFKGIYLDKNTIRKYTKPFKVYFSNSFIDKTEYDHTTNLYIVKKDKNKKELRYIYSAYPYDMTQINLDLKELLNES